MREALGVHLAAPEDGIAVRVRDLALGPPDHDVVQQSAVVGDRLGGREQLVVQKLDVRPELKGVALVRGCGKKQQIPAVVAKHFGEAVVLRGRGLTAAARTRQMVRLVEDRGPTEGRPAGAAPAAAASGCRWSR